ncbi:MAG: DNA polymerase III subunit alpha [Armatimonadetes bacterium]|nr:DNA polymerase III subunit alpha [Armatimonadota bacterium]
MLSAGAGHTLYVGSWKVADVGTDRFIHLHTHSEFSLLDGACRIKEMVKQAVDFEMPALALTDHGVMYGIISFYEACKDAGIKPVLGCEVYVAPRARTSRNPKLDAENSHLVLLAENETGYKNLLKLVSIGHTEGFYYKPRVDREVLAEHSKGLIALTACLAGEVPKLCINGETEKAEHTVRAYQEIFGRDNFYLELQDHNLPEQKGANEALVALASRLGAPLVATNDVHYLKQKDAAVHDVLLCIQTGATVDDPDRLRFGSREFFMKSSKQMAGLFGDVPGAIENTIEIAERCNVELDFSRLQLPEVYIPEGMDDSGYMEQLVREGLQLKIPNATQQYRDRLRYEIDTINSCGFARYMLIVREYAKFARDAKIFMGVRGSAAGSLVCHCLDITDFDPIEFGLTFERFLNVERVEMPDIDMDFQDDRREDVIRWVIEKYGADHVAQIVTFGTLAARAAVRDAGRATGVPAQLVDKVCKAIPTIPIGITIERAIKEVPEFSELYKSTDVSDLVDTARQLEGISRHASVHAAGVIISHDPLTEHVPVQKGAKGELVTQYDADALKKVGLLKMDFLGLANLTILARCVDNVKLSQGIDVDIHNIPLDDEKTYEMLGRGDTTGVFQLESAGMRRNIQELKPNSVQELAAMVALYRPGPMAHIPKFIRSKFGIEPIEYMHPALEPILKETYGVIVYQDQVLHIVRAVAGFTLGQADIFRRAMGKKKKEEMKKQREAFIAGAKSNGLTEKQAIAMFDMIEPFAGYAFNKAHAVCYAHVAYQTAYLKANYPVEYFAAMLGTHVDNKDKVALYIEECRRLRIEVLPPDVNDSEADFTIQNGAIRFGLAAIKNCGKGVVEAVIEARRSGGAFASLHNFCERVIENGQIGKSAVETLIRAGAFASIVPNRKQALEMLEEAMSRAQALNRDKLNGQAALFGGLQDRVQDVDMRKYAHIEDFSREELLAMEKDLLGLYVSDHPLKHVREMIEKTVTVTAEQIQDLPDEKECVVGGIIADLRYHTTKKSNEKMAFLRLEDMTGPISVTVFPSVFKECMDSLVRDRVVVIKGRASHRERFGGAGNGDEDKSYQVEVVAESVTAIEMPNGKRPGNGNRPNGSASEANGEQESRITAVHIRLSRNTRPALARLRSAINAHPGDCPVYIHVPNNGSTAKVCTECCVLPSREFFAALDEIVGSGSVWTE